MFAAGSDTHEELKEKLLKVSTDFLGIDGEKVSECMEEMLFDRSLIEDKIDGKKFVFPPNVHLCEMYIASRIKMLLKFPSEKIKNIDKAIEKCEKEDGIDYADLQKKAITMALTEGMLVLTGGPGTGKTTTLNAIIKIMDNNSGLQSVLFIRFPTCTACLLYTSDAADD